MKPTQLFRTAAYTMIGLSLTLLTTACSSDDVADEFATIEPSTTQLTDGETMKMRLNGELTPFDAAEAGTTRADWTWNTGNTVYILFKSGSSSVSGHATYSGNDEWNITFNGTLANRGSCRVYYFQGAATNSDYITLKTNDAVYADTTATYSISNSEVAVTAALKPLTSRLRLKGTSGVNTILSGVTTYLGYDVKTGKFDTNTQNVEQAVGSSGFTPYVYGVYTKTNRQLSVRNDADGTNIRFDKSFDESVLKVGESGYITVPTVSTNRGWAVTYEDLSFSVTGNNITTSFSMVYVAPGTFDMGYINASNSYSSHHQVTLTKAYYIGKYEVTQYLWEAVTGQKPTSGLTWTETVGLGGSYPAYYISWNDCQTFINSLNTKLSSQLRGRKFRMPTEAEWEYAARGGNKSMGYLYAGSNTATDAGWFRSNSSSKTQASGKRSNELGIYNMSGNVWEWCSDWYGDYSSAAQTDPTGPTSGSQRVRRGGSWDEDPSSVIYRNSSAPNSSLTWLGLRLVLQ